MRTPVRPPNEAAGTRSVTALLTAVMGVSMVQLFLIGALGPHLVQAGVPRTVLGLTTTAGFGVAAALSYTAGRWVDRLGARRCILALLVIAAAALALISVSGGPWMLLPAVALGGLPQALANPATNKVILVVVEPTRRGAVTGWKQSGVQLGALAAGLPLAIVAAWAGWRGAVAVSAAIALLVAVWAARVLPPDPVRAYSPHSVAPPASGVAVLAFFSFLLGCAIAAVNTYLSLYGAQRLGLSPVVAGWLVAVLGVTGVAGRVGWARRAGRVPRADALLAPLAAGACAAALLLFASGNASALVWAGAAAVGAFAVAANAVSMVAVIRRSDPRTAGRDSALVSAGFFAGFAAGPPLFGVVVDATGYGPAWLLVAGAFAAAAVVAAPAWFGSRARP
ncbi:hypothetical protein Sru01_49240 [Sphaerisporangium rufum]|uniref:Major facilitator superfamily (MFS) profile domain-containing protein n=1 Tax=Sphaerisporangium rufum TaxID=1381558 RepID=A0A919R9U5_9ACTN|nr:MFS transporter [Sphaerisporangium rufum]GII79942.1 hypothetical protein Sru01_49240 [Sphaerisporangium rufum]